MDLALNVNENSRVYPDQLYDADFVANLFGIHKQTVYKSIKGTRVVPLPKVTLLGRLIRFRGAHILACLDEMAGITPAEPSHNQAEQVPTFKTIRRRGRPPLLPRSMLGGAA